MQSEVEELKAQNAEQAELISALRRALRAKFGMNNIKGDYLKELADKAEGK